MPRSILLATAALLVAADAFVVRPVSRVSSPLSATYDKKGHHITINPMEGDKGGVDLERARECADNFGKCTVEEIQELRDSKSQRAQGHTIVF